MLQRDKKNAILILTPRLPYALKGDQLLAFYQIKYLCINNDVTLVSFYEHKKDLEHLYFLKHICQRVILIKLSKLRGYLNVFLGILMFKIPFQISYFRSLKLIKILKNLNPPKKFDITHYYTIRMAPYVKFVSSDSVLNIMDSMQLNFTRRINEERGIKKIIFKEELRRLIAFENSILHSFNVVEIVSEIDKTWVRHNNIIVNHLGIDTELFKREHSIPDNKIIIFTGNMNYFPNENAVLWFVKECFPKILEREPDTKLLIAGANPGRRIKKLNSQAIIVTGYVQSMQKEILRARIAIAPLKAGSGMQNKILEYMAMEMPVVTTQIGLGAICAKDGKEIIIADNAKLFSEKCIELLEDYEKTVAIGLNARDLVIRNFSWDRNYENLNKIHQIVSNDKFQENQ